MRFLSSKYLSLFLLLTFYTSNIRADYDSMAEECCRTSCYECSCEPLYCGSWGVQIDGGVRPIIWHGRGDFFSLVNANGVNGTTILADIPKFHSLYRTPWQIGGQLSYAVTTHINVFAEVNYAQASRKHKSGILVPSTNLFLDLSKYKLVDAYVGVRYYSNRWCDRTAFFIGGQIGLIHHKSVDFLSSLTGVCCCGFLGQDFFKSRTSIAGGVNFGIDICFRGNWSFVITGAVIASNGPRSVGSIVLSPSDSANLNGATSLILDKVSTELAFPVTFGIKYNF